MQAHGASRELLDNKESELRLQQRYMQQLQAALAPLPMPDFLRDFLAQVWSQAVDAHRAARRRRRPNAAALARRRRASW